MRSLAVWLGELGIRRPVLVVAALAGLLLCSLPGLARLQVATDLSALIPAQSEAAQALAMVAESLEGSEATRERGEQSPQRRLLRKSTPAALRTPWLQQQAHAQRESKAEKSPAWPRM